LTMMRREKTRSLRSR